MRLRSSFLVLLIAAAVVGCGHRRHARHAQNDGAAPSQPAPQEAPPPEPAATEPAPPAEPEAAPAPEVSATPPQEVSTVSEPPEPVYEEQSPQQTVETVWVPGYWHPEGARWTWYVGEWRSAPHGHVYAEPYYERVGSRVVYVRGYWRPATVAPRSYGGTRIIFVKPARPADYSARYHQPIRAVDGVAPGARLEPRYQPVVVAHTLHNSQARAAQGPAATPTNAGRTANQPPGTPSPARARTDSGPTAVSAPPPLPRTASAPPTPARTVNAAPPPPAPRPAAPAPPTQPVHVTAPPPAAPPPPRAVVAAPPPAPRPVATPAPVKAAPPPAPPPPPAPTATQKKKR